jgi:YHS domain-containing protein
MYWACAEQVAERTGLHMAFLIRVALVVLALYVLWRACARLLRSVGMMSQRGDRPGQPGQLRPVDELVQDPICKLYVPRREALVLRGRGEPLYFCSEKCRDYYEKQGGQQPG